MRVVNAADLAFSWLLSEAAPESSEADEVVEGANEVNVTMSPLLSTVVTTTASAVGAASVVVGVEDEVELELEVEELEDGLEDELDELLLLDGRRIEL